MNENEPQGETAVPDTDLTEQMREENRSINRIPVRLAVSQKGRSAPLGTTRDLSLHGAFIETREPFDLGAVLPLSIEIDPRSPLIVRAEVVRKTPQGMGLSFRDLNKESSRRLRRWVVDHTSVAGSRRQVEQLLEESARIEPIREPARIRGLMAEIMAGGATVTLIPPERVARDYGRLVGIEHDQLVFNADGVSSLTAGEEVYALLTLQFVSYSFALRVRSVGDSTVRCDLPTLVVFSERRNRSRLKAPAGAFIQWPSPWQHGSDVRLPLVDISDDGLSFRASLGALLAPGAPLEGASVVIEGRVQALTRPEVRNLVRVDGPDGAWLRVGVALGSASIGRQKRRGPRVQAKTPIGRLIDRFKSILSVVLHKGRERLGRTGAASRRVMVRGGALPIIGILDRTCDDEERVSAPLVIVVPGFAGRKEQLSFFAGTLIEGFQRQNADIAVLRIDGTNNLGESGKDPECASEGMHCMHYSASGVVDDTLAALAWAKNNPFIEPTNIVILSASAAASAVLRVMTLSEGRAVDLWFSYMGAADVIDLIKNGTGNIDFHSYFMRGEKVGIIALHGVLMNGDHFWRDLHKVGFGYLDHGRADMAMVSADVVWLIGKHDALVDPRRVEALMRVPAKGTREIIEVDGGHLPRTGDEAVLQFTRITERIWKKLHGNEMPPFKPSIGKLVVKAEAEWKEARRGVIADRAEWWRSYLLRDGGGIGFDIVEYLPEYVQILELHARRTLGSFAPGFTAQTPPLVLELGAGTGNLTKRLLSGGAKIIATDLVADALCVTRSKLGADIARFVTDVVDLEGSPWLAMKRFISGDLPNAIILAERIPGVQRSVLAAILEHDDDDVHGILRGHDIDQEAFARRTKLPAAHARMLKDLNMFAKVVAGRLDSEAARGAFGFLPPSLLDGNKGLRQSDASVDAVTSSFVLSYLTHPEDTLAEAWRVLRPGGTLVVSSMVTDSDSSRMYLDLVSKLEQLPEADLPAGTTDPAKTRVDLANAARQFVEHAAQLFRLEEEGQFRFYTPEALTSLVARRGFIDISVERAFGTPPQAIVVTCRKP